MSTVKLEDYTFVPIELVTDVPASGGLVEVFTDRWWTTRNGEIAFFLKGHAPCNSDRGIAERVAENCPWDDVEVVFVPRVVLPVRIREQYSDGKFAGINVDYIFPEAAR